MTKKNASSKKRTRVLTGKLARVTAPRAGTRASASRASKSTSVKSRKTSRGKSTSSKHSAPKPRAVTRSRKATRPKARSAPKRAKPKSTPKRSTSKSKATLAATRSARAKRSASKDKRSRGAKVPARPRISNTLRHGFPKRGTISPVFAKYVEEVTDDRRVTYVQVEGAFFYAGEDEEGEEIRKRGRRRSIPVKLGYFTRDEVDALSREDVEELVAEKYGDKFKLYAIHGFLHRKPDEERKGVYFTKARAKKAARAALARENKQLRSKIHHHKRAAKADAIAKRTLAEENTILRAQLKHHTRNAPRRHRRAGRKNL